MSRYTGHALHTFNCLESSSLSTSLSTIGSFCAERDKGTYNSYTPSYSASQTAYTQNVFEAQNKGHNVGWEPTSGGSMSAFYIENDGTKKYI